jgi:hypothetical protein
MSSVDGERTVERFVDCQALGVGLVHRPDHVEVDSVPPYFESLPDVCHFHVRQAAYHRVVTWRMQKNISSKLVWLGAFWVSSEH